MLKEDIEQKILSIIKKVLKKQNIQKQDFFIDIGCESIEALDVLGLVNREYKLCVLPSEVLTLETVDSLIQYITTKILVKN
jgi:acyl carrier protein